MQLDANVSVWHSNDEYVWVEGRAGDGLGRPVVGGLDRHSALDMGDGGVLLARHVRGAAGSDVTLEDDELEAMASGRGARW